MKLTEALEFDFISKKMGIMSVIKGQAVDLKTLMTSQHISELVLLMSDFCDHGPMQFKTAGAKNNSHSNFIIQSGPSYYTYTYVLAVIKRLVPMSLWC